MKKTILLKSAMSILAASVLLASCTQLDSRIDTVDTLETPSVKAVAYPGVNYISWNLVKGAVGYKVTRTVDGEVETSLHDNTKNLHYIDNTLSVNDVDVEYKVYALSDRNPSSRAVYVYNSNAGSASVTNIFPPVGTKAIDLPKYEKDSGWDFDEDADNSEWKDDFIPTAENIKVQLVDGAIHVTAPTKAYLSTRVIVYTGNKEEIFDYKYPSRSVTAFEYQNKFLSKKSVIIRPGEYKFKATVNALNEGWQSAYYEQSEFALNTTITIPAVKTSKRTDNITVKYIDDAQTIARVQFEPAVSADGKEVFAVTDYKVYRALSGTSNLEEVKDLKKDSITIGGKTTDVYVVDDTVPANNVAYDYYVVLSKDGEFESGIPSVGLDKANFYPTEGGDVSLYRFIEVDDDNNCNDVVAKVTPHYNNKIVSVAYAFSTSPDVNKVLDSAYTALTVEPTIADNEQVFLIKDVPENNHVIVKAEFAEKVSTGKANKVVAKQIAQYTLVQANNVNLQIAPLTQQPGDKDLLNNDLIGNLINVNSNSVELVSVKYATAKDAELAKVAAVSGEEITFTVKDYNEGEGGGWNGFDYKFDIPNAGKVGEYIAIAVEVKAKEGNAKNSIIVQATENSVEVKDKYDRNINSYSVTDTDTKGTEVTNSLNVYLYKDIFKSTNKIDNYDSVEISYIATDSSYQINEKAEWKKIDSIKVTSFESEPKTGNDYIHKKVNIATQTYDSAKTDTPKTDYYVIKVVTKYNVPGAKEDENYLKSSLSYKVKK